MAEENVQNNKNRSFVGGAIVLGIAGLIIKVLGAAFRIPLTNIIGDDGIGYYQTAYPIYVFFLTIATAGIPTAISRMVAERNALDRPHEAFRVFRLSLELLFSIGLVSSLMLFFGAGAITDHIKEPGAIFAMRAIAPALLFCPVMAAFRGFFQGRQNMSPTAVSQVIEQLFRVSVGLGLAVLLLKRGVEYSAAGASFGATAGGAFGLIGMIVIYLRQRPKIRAELAAAPSSGEEKASRILRDMLIIAVPITLGSTVMPIVNIIDTAIVKSRLIDAGFSSDVARGLYGQLTGMAAPLINFPQVLTQAVSMSLVPVVASAFKRKEIVFMQKNIALGLRYALIISAPMAVGMMVLSEPVMLLLYPLQKESAISAAACLRIFAIGIVFLAIIQTLTGILQGVGRQRVPVRNLFFGVLAKILITYTLTGIPFINVSGAAVGTVCAYVTAAVLNLVSVRRYTGARLDIFQILVKPVMSSAVMGVAAWLSYRIISGFAGNAVSSVVSIFVGVIVYALMVIVTQTLTIDELEAVQGGGKLAKMAGKFMKCPQKAEK